MIRLGLRLAIGREAILRLVMIAVAVALGVGMLLGILAGINAVQKQGDRYAIINTSATTPGKPGADPLWWSQRLDVYRNQVIEHINLITQWDEFKQFFGMVKPLDVRGILSGLLGGLVGDELAHFFLVLQPALECAYGHAANDRNTDDDDEEDEHGTGHVSLLA